MLIAKGGASFRKGQQRKNSMAYFYVYSIQRVVGPTHIRGFVTSADANTDNLAKRRRK